MRRLWAGELPLATAFWTCAILWGTALNVVATVAALALLAAHAPAVLAVVARRSPDPLQFSRAGRGLAERPGLSGTKALGRPRARREPDLGARRQRDLSGAGGKASRSRPRLG